MAGSLLAAATVDSDPDDDGSNSSVESEGEGGLDSSTNLLGRAISSDRDVHKAMSAVADAQEQMMQIQVLRAHYSWPEGCG